VTACYTGSWLSPDATHWAGEWRLAMDLGELCWTSRADLERGLGGEDVRFCDLQGRWKSIALEPLEHYDRAGCLHEFVSCVADRRAPECDGRDNLWTLAMVRAAVASAAASGVEVAVEL
jgi:predicted dehydrogenase